MKLETLRLLSAAIDEEILKREAYSRRNRASAAKRKYRRTGSGKRPRASVGKRVR